MQAIIEAFMYFCLIVGGIIALFVPFLIALRLVLGGLGLFIPLF
jgi:hypothetical protein